MGEGNGIWVNAFGEYSCFNIFSVTYHQSIGDITMKQTVFLIPQNDTRFLEDDLLVLK